MNPEIQTIPMHGLSILFDNQEIMHAIVSCSRPQNREETSQLLRELVNILESAEQEDKELLGEHSPIVQA